MIVTLLILLSVNGMSSYRQFCDTESFDSVFNFGHFVHFMRCGEVWTWDPRMDANVGGFLRDWSLYQLARKHLWKDNDNTNDFRFSGFSFQELNCFNHEEDLFDSCYRSTKSWDHFTVLFTNHSSLTFKYATEYTAVNTNSNPFELADLQELKPTKEFWPHFPQYNPKNLAENYLSALYDPNLEVLFLALKYNLKILITYSNMKKPLHNAADSSVFNDFNKTWAQPFVFDGHLIGMFYNEHKKRSFVVGEVLRDSRVHNDQVYPLAIGSMGSPVIVQPSEVDSDQTPENMRTHFGCKYTPIEKAEILFKRRKRIKKVKRCVPKDNGEEVDIQIEEPVDNNFHFLTRYSSDPKVMITLSLLVVILSFILLYQYLDLYGKV